MSKPNIHTRVLQKGRPPFCLKSHQQCRGCFGWRNMLKAARSNIIWQQYPFKCLLTGLTLKIEQPSNNNGDKTKDTSPESEGYYRPRDVEQAIALLSKYGNKAKIMAGGTDLLSLRQGGKKKGGSALLVDISDLGLNYIRKKKDCICVGTTTDINAIAASPFFSTAPYRVLSEAALCHSTYTIRNRATIGGNLCNASPCADLALPLLALDASIVAAKENGEQNIQLDDFYKGVNLTALEQTQILKEIVIPLESEKSSASFLKLRRHQTAIDMAVVNVATRLSFEKNLCLSARIALGSVGPISFRAKKAEALLAGKIIDKDVIRLAARTAADESSPIDDIRATSSYRKEMVAVLVQNSLEKSLQRNQE